MNHILTIMKKELRSYFLSPVALIFLGIFLIASFALFFRVEDNVFIRNLVDVRPLFRSLPLLLIFLVSAITMKQWSEEQKLGTLEILLTLPVKTHHLVIGKFLGGWLLCVLALALTISLPLTVDQLGNLDWGPVMGGYLGAVLLSGAYLAIGLCISARTDNQIVALMLTLVIGGIFYVIGGPTLTELVSADVAETFRDIGTSSRFESIERGLLDLRDLVYFLSLTVFFLALNVFFLEVKRMDSQPKDALSLRTSHLKTLLLIGANAICLNMWLAPVSSVRIDLTQGDDYTISQVTKTLLSELEEPLEIQFLFTEKTHEKLKPLIPQVRDMLQEYASIGGDKLKLSFADPFKNKRLEETLTDLYNIKSEPLPVTDQNSRGIANVYFHILIRYGNQFEVLSFRQLVEAHAEGGDYRIRLRNLEYDLTSSIRKVTQGFQSVESLLAKGGTPTKVTVYLSKQNYPEAIKEIPESVKKAAIIMAERTKGQIQIEIVDPSDNPTLQAKLQQDYGFQPMALGMFSDGKFWSYIVVQRDHKIIPAPLLPEFILGQQEGEGGSQISAGDIQALVESFIKRLTPGFKKTIGIVTRSEGQAPPSFPGAAPQQPNRDFNELERALNGSFNVRLIDLGKEGIPTGIDVLILGKTGQLDPRAWFAIDQYLMLGGSIIAMASSYEAKNSESGWQVNPLDEGLLDLLKSYGVTVKSALVMDSQNFDFPFPVEDKRGEYVIRRIEQVDYPYFPRLSGTGFQEGNLAFKGVKELVFPWANPVWLPAQLNAAGDEILDERGLPRVKLPQGLQGEYLSWTSREAWLDKDDNIAPDLTQPKALWFGAPEEGSRMRLPLAVNIQGKFTSHFADKANPNLKIKDETEANDEPDNSGRTLKQSPDNARLIVLGSSEMLSDKGHAFPFHPNFLQNLIDWSLEDTALLSIRSAGAFAKTLRETEAEERQRLEWMNYFIVFALLGIVFGSTYTRRNLTNSIMGNKSSKDAA
jgi:ABC-2 type transport system permease protein